MKGVFADTAYFIALVSESDDLHADAVEYATLVSTDAALQLVTTDGVLVEVLNGLAEYGRDARERAVAVVGLVRESGRVEPQTQELLREGTQLYADRPDKNWSVTDCMSILVMERLEIADALSADACFNQAGKRSLLRPESLPAEDRAPRQP